MDKTNCRVVFKMTPVCSEYEQECIAFLLDVDANFGYVMSYMHFGQHGEASLAFYRQCRLATEDEYRDLLWELDSIGYDVAIRSRYCS